MLKEHLSGKTVRFPGIRWLFEIRRRQIRTEILHQMHQLFDQCNQDPEIVRHNSEFNQIIDNISGEWLPVDQILYRLCKLGIMSDEAIRLFKQGKRERLDAEDIALHRQLIEIWIKNEPEPNLTRPPAWVHAPLPRLRE